MPSQRHPWQRVPPTPRPEVQELHGKMEVYFKATAWHGAVRVRVEECLVRGSAGGKYFVVTCGQTDICYRDGVTEVGRTKRKKTSLLKGQLDPEDDTTC